MIGCSGSITKLRTYLSPFDIQKIDVRVCLMNNSAKLVTVRTFVNVRLFKAKNRMFEFDYQKINAIESVWCSNNGVWSIPKKYLNRITLSLQLNKFLNPFKQQLRKLVDFCSGLIDLAAISKAYCQRRVAEALFEGKQPCFSSDATAGGLQQPLLPKFTQSPTVDPFFFKITSSGVAYFCKSEGVHLTEMSIQSKISFWNSTDLGSLTGNAQCGNFKL